MDPAIKNMTSEEKLALVEELWEDLETTLSKEITNEQMEHIKARIKAHESGGNQGKSWDEIKKKYL